MGDARFDTVYGRVRDATDRVEAIRALGDEELVAALGGASKGNDPYLANVLASEVANRVTRMHAVMEDIGEGVISVDVRGRVLMMNRAATRIGGWDEAPIGQDLHALVHGREEDPRACPLLRDLADPQTREGETEFLSSSGPPIPVAYTSSTFARDETPLGNILVFRDVTERLQAVAIERERAALLEETARNAIRELQARREAQDRLTVRDRQLAEAQRIGQLGYWEWDVISNEVTWSEELHRLFGRPRDGPDLTYESYLEVLPPEDRPLAEAVIGRALATGEPFEFEHQVILPNGEVRAVLGRGIVEMRGEQAVRMAGTAQDITMSWVHTEEARQRMAEVSATNARLEQFAQGVTNELKASLALLMGHLALADRRVGTLRTAKDVDHLARAEAAARSMDDLIRDISGS